MFLIKQRDNIQVLSVKTIFSRTKVMGLLMKDSFKKIKKPELTVDVIIRRADDSIVLIKRKNPPFKDFYALPGGFVEYGETVEEAAVRETKEETGLSISLLQLIGVYSNPERDPRGHIVSVVFLAKEIGGTLRACTDASDIKIFKRLPNELAFDHKKILMDAFKLSRCKTL